MIPFHRYMLFIVIAVPVVVGLFSLIAVGVIISSSKDHIYEELQRVPSRQAALILGAAVLKNGGLSPVLRDRADQAIELYESGKVERIIASGNTAAHASDEVEPMRVYLSARGIPPEAIILDGGGFDTYSSIYRAKEVFSVQSLAIVSQSFHLPRAVFIARELGIDAVGVSADRGHYKITNYIREMGADIKAIGNLVTNRVPSEPQPSSKELFPIW
jgi:SanA protein